MNKEQKTEVKKAILIAMSKQLFYRQMIDLTTLNKMMSKIDKL